MLEAGNDPTNSYSALGSGAGTDYTKITSIGSTSGSYTAPIVFDGNNDGTNEIFLYGGNNVINVLNGDDPTIEQGSVIVGDPIISGVACDIDSDGFLEYVGAFDNGTMWFLTYFDIGAGGGITQGPSTEIDDITSVYGKIVCDDFFQSEGDSKNYALFIDTEKYLHYAALTGSAWSHTVIDPDGSTGHEDGNDFSYGDNDLSLMESPGIGEKVLVWIAGTYIHGYTPSGEEFSDDFSSKLVETIPSINNGIFSGVRESPTGNDKVFLWTSQVNVGGGIDTDVMLYKVTTFLGNPKFALDNDIAVAWGGSLTRNHHVAGAIGAYDNTGGTEDLILRQETENRQGTNGVAVRVYSGLDLALLNSTGSISLCSSAGDRTYPNRMFYVDMNGDGNKDVLTTCRTPSNEDVIYYLQGDGFTQNQTIHTESPASLHTPVPVDYNRDGFLDLIQTTPGETYFLQSSVTTTTEQNYPFSVALESQTEELEAFMDVQGEYENPDALFNYALVCSVSTETVWNERFGLQYQFNNSGVSLNVFPPEDLLTFDGLELDLDGVNFSQFDLLKEHTEGVRDNMIVSFAFTEPTNRTYDLIMFADDSTITEYWRLNKTVNNLTITKIVPFVGSTVVGSVSVASEILIDFIHEPTTDSFSGQKYFNIDIRVNNNTIVSDNSNIQFSGENIKKVEAFTDDLGSVSVQYISLALSTDLEPGFVQFQNGVQIESGGFTTTVPAPLGDEIAGNGYTVLPGINDDFQSLCEYEETGTYVQRHYLAPPNTGGDYSNYEEITVEILGTDIAADGFDEGVLSDDPLVTQAKGFLAKYGIESTLGWLLVWTLLIVILAAWGFARSPILGIIVFIFGIIVGTMIGVYPIWFTLLLAILSVASVVVMFRKIFVGD